MKLLHLTLGEVTHDLALDHWLLDIAENQWNAGKTEAKNGSESEVFRLWESPTYAVILGQSCKVHDEVHVPFCKENSIQILRRMSGGGTVLIGPGCLMFTVVVSYQDREDLRMIDRGHEYVLNRVANAISKSNPNVKVRGSCDLVLDRPSGAQKFSGNAMRCRRNYFLYHGTLLYDFDLELIPKTLKHPPRQPDYRDDRSHLEFVANLNGQREQLESDLIEAWNCSESFNRNIDSVAIQKSVEDKFGNDAWNFRR